MRLTLGALLLAIAGCATTLDDRISPCRPEATAPLTAGKADAELECNIRVQDRTTSKSDARKPQ